MLTCQRHASLSRAARCIHGCTTSDAPTILQRTPRFEGMTTPPPVPDSLWDRLRADPVRAPEHVALAASEKHAPAAAAWAAEKRGRLAVGGPELARMAKRR